MFEGTKKLASASLTKYKVSKEQQPLITGRAATAYSAHLRGDEKKPETIIDTEGFGFWLKFVAWVQEDLIEGWWTDLSPRDNDIVIDLGRGLDTAMADRE